MGRLEGLHAAIVEKRRVYGERQRAQSKFNEVACFLAERALPAQIKHFILE